MEPVHTLTVTEASARIRRGELSAVSMVEALLARTDQLDPSVKAWVTVGRTGAFETGAWPTQPWLFGSWRATIRRIRSRPESLWRTTREPRPRLSGRPPRLGLPRQFFLERARLEVAARPEAIVRNLARAGASVEEIKLPQSFEGLHAAGTQVMRVEAAVFPRGAVRHPRRALPAQDPRPHRGRDEDPRR